MRHLYHFNSWLITASLPTKCNTPTWITEMTLKENRNI